MISYRSLLLSTIVLNDIVLCILSSCVSVALFCDNSISASSRWNLKILDNITINNSILDGRGTFILDGTGTFIAILDTGVYPSYIGKQVYQYHNYLRDEPLISDHGTACSSIVVGASSLSKSLDRGVAPGANLIVCRVAEGNNYDIDAILKALRDIQNAIKNKNLKVDVVSMSFEYYGEHNQTLKSEIEKLTEMGVACVAAAGNRGFYQPHASIPARFDSVISVGALDRNGKKSDFTAQGRVDVYAPGEDIQLPSGTSYGTSFATPAVGGLVLLLKQLAIHAGSPAKNYIHYAEILRQIFSKDMVKKPDSGNDGILAPSEFFKGMIKCPTKLNAIVEKHIGKEILLT